jgi:hypothetical protein
MSEAVDLDWTIGSLRLLRGMSHSGATLAQIARRMGVTPGDCDRALWALLGRTPEAAALYLRGHG